MPLRPLVLALLLVTAPALAVDIEFSSPLRTGPAAYTQYGMLASNGIDYLSAWTTQGPETHVYATQILADGNVLQAIPTQLDSGTGAKAAWGVSISAGRDGYFASWLTDSGVSFAVLDSYGRVERTSSFNNGSVYGGTGTAWDGSTHLVLYGMEGGGSRGALVDDNAKVIVSGIEVGPPPIGGQGAGTLIADASGFLVISSGSYPDGTAAMFARRIYASGVTEPWVQLRTLASPLTSLVALYDGTRDIIVWVDRAGIWKAELDPKTNALGASVQVLPGPATWARITRLNGQMWIVWWAQAASTAIATPLNADGTPGPSTTIGKGYVPDISTNGQSILTIRSVERDPSVSGNMDVVGHFALPAGNDFVVSKSQTDQADGDLASDGTTVLTVWDEEIGTSRQVFAARHPRGQASQDGAGVQISSGAFNRFPTAASNGKTWLVAWIRAESAASSGVAVARRFSSDGHVLDNEDIVLGPASSNTLRIASDGSSWVVAWLAARPGGGCGLNQSIRPMLARVSSDGVVLHPGGVDITASSPLDTTEIDLAWDGSRYVAAWVNYCSPGGRSPASYGANGAFISSDLGHVDIVSLNPLTSGPSSLWMTTPRVLATSDSILFAWYDDGHTEFQLLDNPTAGKRGRSRAVGRSRLSFRLEGWLIGVCTAATGEPMIFTRKMTPSGVNEGVFFSVIGSNGAVIGSGLEAAVNPGEHFTGHVVRTGGYAWIATTRFSALGGANRQWMTTLDSPR